MSEKQNITHRTKYQLLLTNLFLRFIASKTKGSPCLLLTKLTNHQLRWDLVDNIRDDFKVPIFFLQFIVAQVRTNLWQKTRITIVLEEMDRMKTIKHRMIGLLLFTIVFGQIFTFDKYSNMISSYKTNIVPLISTGLLTDILFQKRV